MADTFNSKKITLREFRITLEALIPRFPKVKLFNCLKLMDINND